MIFMGKSGWFPVSRFSLQLIHPVSGGRAAATLEVLGRPGSRQSLPPGALGRCHGGGAEDLEGEVKNRPKLAMTAT